jgi:hypothetical protein
LATRIILAIVALAMYGFASLLFCLPLTIGGGGADWVVVATGLVIAGFGVFATFALAAAIKTRITITADALDATVVRGNNALLIPEFRNVTLPLRDIRSVERRCEIFRRLGLYSLRDALSIVTQSGERIGLCSDTMGSARTLPIDEVAQAIAAAAGVRVTDDGTVRAKGSGLYGAASSTWTEVPLDSEGAGRARRAAIVTVQVCTLLLVLTFALRACL